MPAAKIQAKTLEETKSKCKLRGGAAELLGQLANTGVGWRWGGVSGRALTGVSDVPLGGRGWNMKMHSFL